MKYLAIIALMLLPLTAAKAQTSSDSARYEQAYHLYEVGRIHDAVTLAKQIPTEKGRLLVALCRERQGFDRAAARIYKKLIADGNAMAAYYYAAKLFRGGHLDKAEQTVQQSITLDRNIPESHLLLASIMATKGERYKAMLPLYYFLLINDNTDNQRLAHRQLVVLWRKSAKVIRMINTQTEQTDFDLNTERYIDSIATSDSIASLEGSEAIAELSRLTQLLLAHLLDTSEENLDFWQVTYTDFLVKLVPRNFVEPYVRYISDATYHPQVLAWINDNQHLFNEFRLWMTAQ